MTPLKSWVVRVVNHTTKEEVQLTIEVDDPIAAQVRALEKQFDQGWDQLGIVDVFDAAKPPASVKRGKK